MLQMIILLLLFILLLIILYLMVTGQSPRQAWCFIWPTPTPCTTSPVHAAPMNVSLNRPPRKSQVVEEPDDDLVQEEEAFDAEYDTSSVN